MRITDRMDLKATAGGVCTWNPRATTALHVVCPHQPLSGCVLPSVVPAPCWLRLLMLAWWPEQVLLQRLPGWKFKKRKNPLCRCQ